MTAKKPKCRDCGTADCHVHTTPSGALVFLCGSCEYRIDHPDAPRPVKLLRERTEATTARDAVRAVRFLPSHKTRAINHTCGNPPTYYMLKYVEALARWRCTGCGRIVG